LLADDVVILLAVLEFHVAAVASWAW